MIANHHSYHKIDGIDFQILVEADFLVNIFEDKIPSNSIENIQKNYFKTAAGISMIESMYINKPKMKYSNEAVRRQDRLLLESRAIELLTEGEYGAMSMCCDDSAAYGIPISYAWNGNESIYIHCATEGKKLNCLDNNSAVSLCVVGKTNVISEKFTTEFESIILQCQAFRNLSDEERMEALMLIVKKYSPNDIKVGEKYAEKSFHRTEIIRLNIEKWSGKSKTM
jgi:nitroimidazol reductase NimA-like FMN-containing flavoprotein (pyridoxamine 5'-phosphate oxidase superfamily)